MEFNLNYSLIGMRLRAARIKMKYTQEYLSELAGISSQHCSGIECGSAKVSLPALIRLCNALRITPNDLLADSVNTPAPEIMKNVADIFADCTPDEIFLMLSQAENLKKLLRLKKYTAPLESIPLK